MKNSKKLMRIIVVAQLFMVLLISIPAQAQITLPDDSTDVDDGIAAPINGLILLGIAAGGALGFKKLNDKKD